MDPRLVLLNRTCYHPQKLWGIRCYIMIVSMPRWPICKKKIFAPLLRTSTFSSFLFFFSLSLLFCATLLANSLAPRRPFPYVYSNGNQFSHAPWCTGCVKCEPVRWLCDILKHAYGDLGPKSEPAPDVVKVVDRSMWCCGSLPLMFVRSHHPTQASDPTDAECVSQPSSFGRSVPSTSVERLMLSE